MTKQKDKPDNSKQVCTVCTVCTGWNNGLSQDYCKKLSQWFASRIDARYVVRKVFSKGTK